MPDQNSEEKNPLIVDARAKKEAFNFQGAAASLEKALEGNPRLAVAHWELGLILSHDLPDPVGAIYHFRKLLKLRPDWRHAETARLKIRECLVEIAKSVPLGPQVPAFQQQFDRMVSSVHDMNKEITQLKTTNQTLRMYVQQLQAENIQLREAARAASSTEPARSAMATAPGAASAASQPRPPSETQRTAASVPGQDPTRSDPVSPRPNATVNPQPDVRRPSVSTPAAPAAPAARSYLQYTVRKGETMSTIARRYGLPLRSLLLANPNINPNRLGVGQVIRIPAT